LIKDKHKPLPDSRRFAPRYWPTWVGIGLLRLFIRLPYRTQLWIGRGLGRLFRLISPYRRTIVAINLKLAFPELAERDRRRLEHRFYASLGMSLIETAAALWAPERFFERLGHVEGLEHLVNAQQRDKGVLLLSGHFCSLDFAGRLLMKRHRICFTFQELRNKLFDRATRDARAKRCHILIHRHDIRGFIRALKAGEVVWYAPDQSQARRNSVFAPFFGIPTNTLTATTKLARLTGAAVLPFSIARLPDARGYALHIEPPLENFPGKDEYEDARRFNAMIETQIRANPEQYLWIHRRFKTRPEGEPSLYPPKPRRIRKRKRRLRAARRKQTGQG
jgi:KDO2-lipid IV(A) lauroyltransferase